MTVRKKGAAGKKSVSKKKPVARKKTVSRRRKKTPKKSPPFVLSELKKGLLGILALISICLTVAMVADILLKPDTRETADSQPLPNERITPDVPVKKPAFVKTPPPEKQPPVIPRTKPDGGSEKTAGSIKFEVFTDIDPTIEEKPRPVLNDQAPRIAIIIDDIGYDRKIAYALFDLEPDLTFSVLPFSPFGRKISEKLHANGAELMLHLPMEPVEYPHIDPGPGAILTSMNPDALLAQLKEDLRQIPHIVGVNNHMGSKLTASAAQMNQIFTILKKENLFFVDSRTAPKSQGKASARLLRLEFAQRDVFLDNFQDEKYITGQLEQLIRIARKHGTAIGIGHPYKVTLETLSHQLPIIKKEIKIVRVSELTHIPG